MFGQCKYSPKHKIIKDNLWIINENIFFKISGILTVMATMRAMIKAKRKIFIFGRVLWKHMWQINNICVPVLSNYWLIKLRSKALWNRLEIKRVLKHIAWHNET